MNNTDDGGMLGVDMECSTYYGVNWMVWGNTNGGGRVKVVIVRNLR